MKARNFHVFCYPSHTTHWLQAADKSFFRSFKSNWNELGQEYLRRTAGSHLPKARFFELFNSAWKSTAIPETAMSGFRATGTWPINFEAVSKAAFAPSATTERAYCESAEDLLLTRQ